MATPTSPAKLQSKSSPSESREENFLHLYFKQLSTFAFDKAKEMAEREKDGLKLQAHGQCWGELVQCLVQFATAEKTYVSLTYLNQKRLVGLQLAWSKETLSSSYQMLTSEFRRLGECVGGGSPALDAVLAHLCGQLCHYLTARHRMMELYSQVSVMASNRNLAFEDLAMMINDVVKDHSTQFHHPILGPLKTSFSLECDIMEHLLTAQTLMSQWQFLPSLLALHQAHSKLLLWQPMVAVTETKRSFVGGSKTPQLPALLQWLIRFKGLLVSKFSLYFYEVLSKQTTSSEMRSLTAKATDDFVGKIQTFIKKCDVTNVSLVLNTQGIEGHIQGPGYHHPHHPTQPTQGMDSYPAIASFPGPHPATHWPDIIMMITNSEQKGNPYDKVICFFDKKVQATYFITKVEPRMTLVVVFETKKSDRDSYINNFMLELSQQLRCAKILSTIKPGTK